MTPKNFFPGLSLLLILLISSNAFAENRIGTIKVIIENIKSSNGLAQVKLFNSPEGFPVSVEKALHIRKVMIIERKAELTFKDLPYGQYAIGAIHDENGNGKMDLKWGFYPAEGAGVSNNPEPGFIRPGFEVSKISLKVPEMELVVRINY